MENAAIAAELYDVASLLELKEANFFRIRAYRNAAASVEEHPEPIADLVARGEDLTRLEFVGKDLAAAIEEIDRTGKLAYLDELCAEVPRSLLAILRIPGIGPKKVRQLWQALGVTDVDSLERAARSGTIAELAGFGAKSQANILQRIERHRARSQDASGES